MHNMQYTKLGFNRLFKACGPYKVLIPIFSYCDRWA